MARPFATEEQREEIRQRIRAAAAAIYREGGVSAVSARAIAQKAGVSVGAIYSHFADLTGLMQSLWMGQVDRQNDVFLAAAKRHGDPVKRVHALLAAYVDFGLENAALYRGAFLFVRPENQPRPEAAALGTFVFAELLLAAVREGQDAGTISPGDPATCVQILWSGVHGCLALPTNMDRVAFAPAREIAKPMVAALVRAISV